MPAWWTIDRTKCLYTSQGYAARPEVPDMFSSCFSLLQASTILSFSSPRDWQAVCIYIRWQWHVRSMHICIHAEAVGTCMHDMHTQYVYIHVPNKSSLTQEGVLIYLLVLSLIKRAWKLYNMHCMHRSSFSRCQWHSAPKLNNQAFFPLFMTSFSAFSFSRSSSFKAFCFSLSIRSLLCSGVSFFFLPPFLFFLLFFFFFFLSSQNHKSAKNQTNARHGS